MKPFVYPITFVVSIIGAWPSRAVAQQSFSFQGTLRLNDTALTDTCAFRFTLKDDTKDGNTVGPVAFVDLPVEDGVFGTTLDFGEVFDGTPYWIEIAVQLLGDDCSTGGYEVLAPRTPLTSTPYAYGLTGPSTVTADDADPALLVKNRGSGDGIRVDSAGGYGVFARGGSSDPAGYFAGDLVTEKHFAYPSERTFTYQVPVAAFEPSGASENGIGQDLDPYWNEVQGYIQVFDGAGTSESMNFAAPVNLPDSVTVTAVKLNYYDNDAANDVQFVYSLFRRALASTAIDGIVVGAALTTSGSSAVVQSESGFVNSANALIQNADYMYWFSVSINQPEGNNWSSSLRFYGMTVEYETSRLSY